MKNAIMKLPDGTFTSIQLYEENDFVELDLEVKDLLTVVNHPAYIALGEHVRSIVSSRILFYPMEVRFAYELVEALKIQTEISSTFRLAE